MNTWFISDTHFGHANICKFLRDDGSPVRAFASVDDMDETLVARWNDLVRPDDTVWHLGDVFFKDGAKHLPRLNGKKNLILGNHDNVKKIGALGVFDEIETVMQFRQHGFVATHYPLHDSDFAFAQGLVNVHGHIHEKPAPTDRHLNISVERTGYAPVHLDSICGWVAEQKASRS